MLLVAIGAKIVTNGGDGVHCIILIYLSSSVCVSYLSITKSLKSVMQRYYVKLLVTVQININNN